MIMIMLLMKFWWCWSWDLTGNRQLRYATLAQHNIRSAPVLLLGGFHGKIIDMGTKPTINGGRMGIDQVSVSVSLPIFQVAIFYLKPGSNSASRQQCFMILLRLMTSKGTWWANVSCPWVLKSVSCCWKSSGRFRTCWGDDLWKRCNAWGTILCERGRFCLHRGRPLNFIPKKTVRYRRNLIMCVYI